MSVMKRDSTAMRELAVVALRAQRRELGRREARIRLRHREAAVGRESFEQDRRERLRVVRHAPPRRDIAHQLSLEPDAHDLAAAVDSASDSLQRGDDLPFHREMREQDDVGLVLAFGRLLWIIARSDVAVGEDARDVGQHAGPVQHAHAQVIARRNAATWTGTACPTDGRAGRRDAARDARGRPCCIRSRRPGARSPRWPSARRRAGAVVQRRPDGVALDQHPRFITPSTWRSGASPNQRRVHAQLDAGGRAAGAARSLIR